MKKILILAISVLITAVSFSQKIVGTQLILDDIKYDTLVSDAYISAGKLYIQRGNDVLQYDLVTGGVAADSIKEYDVINVLTTPPVSPSTGDAYRASHTATTPWVADNIEIWNGTNWIPTAPSANDYCYQTTDAKTYQFKSTNLWVLSGGIIILNNGQNISGGAKIGTTNAQPLQFKTNKIIRGGFLSTGELFLNNLPTGITGDSALVVHNGVIKKVLLTTGGGAGTNDPDSLGGRAAAAYELVANKKTTITNSATDYPSTSAVTTALGLKEDVSNKSTNTSLGTSNTLYPSQNAVKTYIDNGLSGKQDALGFSDLHATSPLHLPDSTLTIDQANTTTDGYLSHTDWNTFNGKQNTITLTTTGTSGAATLTGSTLNIPQYSGGSGGLSYKLTVTATSNGQTTFSFPDASVPSTFLVFRNGYERDTGFSISGTTLTMTDTDITIGETITLCY